MTSGKNIALRVIQDKLDDIEQRIERGEPLEDFQIETLRHLLYEEERQAIDLVERSFSTPHPRVFKPSHLQ